MSVHTVLDVSALRGYATFEGALAVGELVRMIGEENEDRDAASDPVFVGVPAASLLASYTSTDDAGREILAALAADVRLAAERNDPAQSVFTILPLTEEDLVHAGDLELAWPGLGHAMVTALRHNAILATFDPPEQPLDGLRVLDLSAGWDDDAHWELGDPE